MASDPGQVVFGHEVKVEVNSTEFGHTGGSMRFTGDAADCGDSTNGNNKKMRVGLRTCELNIKALRNIDTNIHSAPLLIDVGENISEIKVYMDGADQDPYVLNYVEITAFSPTFERGNPAGNDFTGSAWEWIKPGDA